MSYPSKKIGLALSGGGLRASFFHIGLLAQMAEQGLLKSVEVISTVSGGSIIGALYYMHLKKCLELKVDGDISDQDYIEIIQTIEVDFLKATEKNIRMNILADVRKNFKMKGADYSRSHRIAELYNDLLYQSVLENSDKPIEMQNLKITPKDGSENFNPKDHNHDRIAKVPVLVLNATSLNAGRNWQFTARTMGEPRSRETAIEVDTKPIRLRRATGNGYQKMPDSLQSFKLGDAVAASACVPGLFEPLPINDLYYDKSENEKITPQLVDGGVFDNQGIESLLTSECTHFIISDASGQMGMENEVDTSPLPVVLRVSSILQDRIRSEGISHLIDSKGEKNIAFIDSRKGLGSKEISWNNKTNTPKDDTIVPPSSEKFGVAPEVQEKLSLMRTDLDAFTEVEAYSLMLDAYQMSKLELRKLSGASPKTETSWKFNQIADLMENPKPEYLKQLEISQLLVGKPLHAFPWLWAPIILIIATTLFYAWSPLIQPVLDHSYTVYALLLSLFLWLATIFAPKLEKTLSTLHYLRPRAMLLQRFGKSLLLVAGSVYFMFYLKVINPMYLAQGRITALKKNISNK